MKANVVAPSFEETLTSAAEPRVSCVFSPEQRCELRLVPAQTPVSAALKHRPQCQLRPVPARTLALSCVPGPATKPLCSQVSPLLVIIEKSG